jgi:predicted DNA-binding transcriptional regulator AlpA
MAGRIVVFAMTELRRLPGRSAGPDQLPDRSGPADQAGTATRTDTSQLLPRADAALAAIARTMAGAVPQRRAEVDALLAASLSAWREREDGPPGWSPDAAGLMSRREIGEFFRLGKSAAYDLTRRADFPPPVVVSTRCLRWPQRDVTEFAEGLRGSPARRRGHPRAASHPAGTPAGQRRITGRVRAAGERRETL